MKIGKKRFPTVAEDPALYKTKTAPELFHFALADFADSLRAKFEIGGAGEAEEKLRAPLEMLFENFGAIIGRNILLMGEARLKERVGKPDFAVHDDRQTIGFVEAKAPGKGANPAAYKGHDQEQWQRFKAVPNILYTDGIEWALFRSGEREGPPFRFRENPCAKGGKVLDPAESNSLFQIFAAFCSWTPIVPQKPKDLAEFLAPYCRLIRDEVDGALENPRSPLQGLKKEIKNLLFPEATDHQFADAYAQTVIFALLLAKLEGANALELSDACRVLESEHLLLSRSLQFLTDQLARQEIATSLGLTQRVIQEVRPEALKKAEEEKDPWLFFYEYFLAKYDPKLRKEWGVYYTPVEVVRCQVSLIDEILSKEMGKTMGFVEPGVISLDPAVGTGTYLLGIIEHALGRIEAEEGKGAIKGGARSLASNLHGFEWMVGPYAVAQLRFSRALLSRGATLPSSGIGIYLTNTLESPHTQPPVPPLFHKPIAEEHKRALKVKDAEHVLVCLGNPPYGRHEAAETANHAVTGGWVRYGDEKHDPILENFLEPARKAGFGVHLKNLYNQYVYFIRWALWKVFEHESAVGPGIVSFITASSYLDGDAFAGLREHMRRVCDRIDIIDLGGEGRGTRKDENVFAIQTPVAIFVARRKEKKSEEQPAIVRYTRIEGNREQKLKKLNSLRSFKDLNWKTAPVEWQAGFFPKNVSPFSNWPLLAEIFPWQLSGAQYKRTWPIGPEISVLTERWKAFVNGSTKKTDFKETRDRKINKTYPFLFPDNPTRTTLDIASDNDLSKPIRYAYRSFDRQYAIPDNRLGDYLRPILWNLNRDNHQIFLATLSTKKLGAGPALTATAFVPDLDFFSNRGGKDIFPLYRDSSAKEPNILPGLIDMLSKEFRRTLSPDDFTGYVYSVLAQPEYTSRFSRELGGREIRVPLTKSAKDFFTAAEFGKALIWLHTYGERMSDKGRPKGSIPPGKAKCLKAVPDDEERYPNEFAYDEDSKKLHVGEGVFGPVEREVFDFEVSGFRPVKSWLGYRMKDRSGKKSSPLDDIRPKSWTREFTRELLELLWVLEKTVAGYPGQKEHLEKILAGPLFAASELPSVPPEARQAPSLRKKESRDRLGPLYEA